MITTAALSVFLGFVIGLAVLTWAIAISMMVYLMYGAYRSMQDVGSSAVNSREIPPKYSLYDPINPSPEYVEDRKNDPRAVKGNDAPEASAPSYKELFPQ